MHTVVRQRRPLHVERPAQVEHEPANRVGRTAAVAEQILEGVVALDELVLLEGGEQVEERLGRNVKSADGVAQGDEDGMVRLAVVTAAQLLTPPAEQGQGARSAAGLIRQIVGPAAVGVDGVEMTDQGTRQQDRGDGEVFVVGPRQATAIKLCPCARGWCVGLLGTETRQLHGESIAHGRNYTRWRPRAKPQVALSA